MKKLLLVTALFAVIHFSAGAQKLEASKVPDAVKKSFTKQHPAISPKWENENGQFEAGFKQHGKSISVLYTADGTMTETEVDIAVAELPTAVLSYVKDHYKGAGIREGAKITKADGTINYEAEVNKMDVLFDAGGKFIKEVKD